MMKLAVRLHLAWERFKAEERGAQTLEWLALALLILAILGTAASFSTGNFAKTLQDKFMGMVDSINSPAKP